MKKMYKKTTVYVVRCDNKNNLQESAPCQNCLKMLIELNIKRIVFSSKNDTFISSDPKLLSPMHISAGNKFINKKFSINSYLKSSNESSDNSVSSDTNSVSSDDETISKKKSKKKIRHAKN
jgi:deoxycytidylate deaminase